MTGAKIAAGSFVIGAAAVSKLGARPPEFERELIRVRTGEGRRRAVEAGVKLGRRSSRRHASRYHRG
jgi:hypothetical protein